MYLSVAAFLVVLTAFNYTYDFENGWIDRRWAGTGWRPILFFSLHFIAYFGTLLIIRWFRPADRILTPGLWLKGLLAMIILGIDRSFFLYDAIRELAPAPTLLYYYRCASNLASLLTAVLPMLALLYVFDRHRGEGFYGLRLRNVNYRPYWIMLGMMVLILGAVSFLPGMQDYYPTYKRGGVEAFAAYYQWPRSLALAVYEFIYLGDIAYTEMFHRGLLVVGFSRLLGKNCILPMVAGYCVLHFGKPLGETIGSVFGAYILGVIALYCRNIWGGLVLHCGVAFFMDLFATLHMPAGWWQTP